MHQEISVAGSQGMTQKKAIERKLIITVCDGLALCGEEILIICLWLYRQKMKSTSLSLSISLSLALSPIISCNLLRCCATDSFVKWFVKEAKKSRNTLPWLTIFYVIYFWLWMVFSYLFLLLYDTLNNTSFFTNSWARLR